jgi:hypothetical protein
MDARTDGERFGKLIDQLYACLNEGRKAPDALRDGFWRVCRDVSYEEVKANAERIMATATRDTRFPPPSALRNSPAHISAPGIQAQQRKVEANAIRTWRELRQRDPVRFEIEFRIAQAETMLAQMSSDDGAASEWMAALIRWRGLRYAERAEQETAVRQVTT